MKLLEAGKYVLVLGVGVLIGLLVNDLPGVSLVRSVRLGELLNSTIVLLAAFFIPVAIKRILERRQFISDLLINDAKDLILTIGDIMDVVNSCCIDDVTSKKEKRKILFLVDAVDIKLDLLKKQTAKQFPNNAVLDGKLQAVENSSASFWRSLTGGDLMKEDYKIDKTFHSAQVPRFTHLKTAIHDFIIEVDRRS